MTDAPNPLPSAEKDAGVEYRVMYWSAQHQRWFSHTGAATTSSLKTATAWLEQATYRGGRSGRIEAVIEQRETHPWTRVLPPGGSDD